MQPDQPVGLEDWVEELNPTIRTYSLVKNLGCTTIRDLTQLSARDILYSGSGNRRVIDEINVKLGELGLGPLSPGERPDEAPPVPDVAEYTFGSLCLPLAPTKQQIRETVIEAYAAEGAEPVDYDTFIAVPDGTPGLDVVMINQPVGRWFQVTSELGDLEPQRLQPLALRLSQRWPVLSVTSVEDAAFEVCLYRDGRPEQYEAHGHVTTPAPADAPLDYGLLVERAGIPVDEDELRSVFGNPWFFSNLAGLPLGGHESATHHTSLYELCEYFNVLLFRQRD